MTEAVLVPLRVEDVNPDDVRWLQKVIELDKDGYSVESVLELARAGRCRIWRVVGAASGVVVTQLQQQPAGIEMLIWYLSGWSLIKYKDTLSEQLQNYGRTQGARWMTGITSRDGLVNTYQAMGMKPVSTILRMEL